MVHGTSILAEETMYGVNATVAARIACLPLAVSLNIVCTHTFYMCSVNMNCNRNSCSNEIYWMQHNSSFPFGSLFYSFARPTPPNTDPLVEPVLFVIAAGVLRLHARLPRVHIRASVINCAQVKWCACHPYSNLFPTNYSEKLLLIC